MSPDPLDTLQASLADRYRVERLLGSGGMATVYLAHDLKHDRPVAIKVLRPALASVLGPERFLREIQIAAKLNHPHILTLHDSGETAGLLYYVMPYVEGESLQARIAREKQLPVDEAVRIAREVASALAYAHHHGVVHRDIKPGNILLSNGYAMVADFGLARAIDSAKSDVTITASGLTLGTPTYMSPEQSSGAAVIDGRSDLYALGCVLYELLVGDPPFTGSTPSALMARHAAGKQIPIRAIRPAVPAGIEWAVNKALEKVPADRFQSAQGFIEALDRAMEGDTPARWQRWAQFGGVVAATLVLTFALSQLVPRGSSSAEVDSTRYAVLPFEFRGGRPPDLPLEQLVQDALGRWGGISVVDGFQVAEAVGRRGATTPLTTEDAEELAARLGAGRFIRGETLREGDSLRLRVSLYAVGTRDRLRERSTRVGPSLGRVDSSLALLIDELLFPVRTQASQPTPVTGSRMLPALLAFVRADSAVLRWDLDQADSSLSTALTLDPEYAQAALNLALVRLWAGAPTPRWRPSAEQAMSRADKLSARDRMLARALVAQGEDDFPTACGIWRQLTRAEGGSFTGWFGLATCLRRDRIVVPDARSPSGWRFRSSYHEAVQAYRRAFELLPSIHFGLRADGYTRLRGDMLYTTGRILRPGRALPPDTNTFYAYPEWSGDSLLFYPFPATVIQSGGTGRTEQQREGVLQQRRLFLQIAQSWAASYPGSADALEALAISLELLGDPSALDTLRRARSLARTRAEGLRVAASEVWVRLKFALPDNLAGLELVRALADSLLDAAGSADAPDAVVLAPIAALRGHPALAARFAARSGRIGGIAVDRALQDGPGLWAYAAVGGPPDSVRVLEERVSGAIEGSVSESGRAEARREWLSRAASLMFPELILRGLEQGGPTDALLLAQSAAAKGRRSEALAELAKLAAIRRDVLPERLAFDAVLAEAKLLAFLGETQRAIEWLDPALGALRRTAPQGLSDVVLSASLVRAMALRAELALGRADTTAAIRWSRPVTILWSNPDPFLIPLIQRLRHIGG